MPALLRDLIPRLGNYGAIQSVAATLAEAHGLDTAACLWVVREFARALGLIASGGTQPSRRAAGRAAEARGAAAATASRGGAAARRAARRRGRRLRWRRRRAGEPGWAGDAGRAGGGEAGRAAAAAAVVRGRGCCQP